MNTSKIVSNEKPFFISGNFNFLILEKIYELKKHQQKHDLYDWI